MIANFKNSTAVLQKLLTFKSVQTEALPNMPFGEENAKCLNFMLDVCKNLGFLTKNVDNYCGYAEIGTGELFGVLGHLDVVPEGENWNYPAYGGEIHDGKIYGRGAEDNKGPMVAALFACAKLLQDGKTPNKRIRFIFGSNEESGWKCMERYEKTEEMPALGFSPDADFPVVNCEKGVIYHTITCPLPKGIKEITGGERANIVPPYAKAILESGEIIETHGKAAHGSKPQIGENAIVKLLEKVAIGDLYKKLSCYNGSGLNLNISDKESGNLTMNLGTIITENGYLKLQIDIRYPITFEKDFITETIKKALPFCTVEQGAYHRPIYVSPEDDLIKSLLWAYEKVTGTKAKPITIGGATYARCLNKGVSFGPVFPNEKSTIHQENEFMSVANFEKLQNIYGLALEKLCFGN